MERRYCKHVICQTCMQHWHCLSCQRRERLCAGEHLIQSYLKPCPHGDFFLEKSDCQQSKGARQSAKLVNSLCVDMLVVGLYSPTALPEIVSNDTASGCKHVCDCRSHHSGTMLLPHTQFYRNERENYQI